MASNKTKKKHEVIRSTLGNYLKQRNYSLARFHSANVERRTQSDFLLETTTRDQIIMNETIKNEISRANSFLYSNVFCLNNNPAQVDKEFRKLQSFIMAQKTSLRRELLGLLPPLLCHLYIEMLKGRDWKPAIEFLKKYANILGTLEPSAATQFTKVNGTMEETAANVVPLAYSVDQENPDLAAFRQLVTTLSSITCIQDIENDIQAAHFRSCKYQIRMSDRTLLALRRYLSKDAHVLILQILQIWIDIDTSDDKSSEAEDEPAPDDSGSILHHNSLNGFSSSALDDLHETDISKFTNLLASPKPATKRDEPKDPTETEYSQKPMDVDQASSSAGAGAATLLGDETKALAATRLQNLAGITEKVAAHQLPMQVFAVQNANEVLCTGNLDAMNCHFACGLEDAGVMLWSSDGSEQAGRKPYGKSTTRQCGWHVTSVQDPEDEMSSDDEEEIQSAKQKKIRETRYERERERFWGKRSRQNVFDDYGAFTFRGHSSGITDLLFSQFSELLITTSRDLTMRAWRATDYSCGAVYRGHNYPIWCVAESATDLYLATGSRDSTARLWSTTREFPLQIYAGHTQDVTAIAFHPNGKYLATGSVDQTIRLWCITSGKLLRVLTDCRLPVHKIAFSPNGKWLAAAGEESRVRIFDLATSSQLYELKDHPSAVSDVVWHADNQKLATATTSGVIRLYNVGDFESGATSSDTKTGGGATLLNQYGTQCKRVVRIKFNGDGSLTCIGSV
ncbi:transcription initiation factor TFIID subunit 5 [Culicoides brevitarsis]|uniref:transcription initiation factor TFIID subunit 5 n=1 Tax=Culicoides brevitarsis TaxID=469753 RepID=UPI00307B4088